MTIRSTPRSSRILGIAALVVGVPAALLALSGCESDGRDRHAEVTADPTPELETLYQRPVDSQNAQTVTNNENLRMFWQDLGRALYTDRPSRLTREPVPRP